METGPVGRTHKFSWRVSRSQRDSTTCIDSETAARCGRCRKLQLSSRCGSRAGDPQDPGSNDRSRHRARRARRDGRGQSAHPFVTNRELENGASSQRSFWQMDQVHTLSRAPKMVPYPVSLQGLVSRCLRSPTVMPSLSLVGPWFLMRSCENETGNRVSPW